MVERTKRAAAVWCGVALIASLGWSATGTAAFAASVAATMSMTPRFGSPTTPVTVKGGGWAPGETVKILFGQKKVASAMADDSGAIDATFDVPKSAPPGQHEVKAKARDSGDSAKGIFTVRTNWPQLGFDLARTFANPFENVIAPDNVAKLHREWRYRLPSHQGFASSPVVTAGVVYVADGAGDLSAVEAATGDLRWQVTLDAPYGIRSPTVTTDTVYASSEYGVFALDRASGAVRWEFGLFEPASVTVANELVYVGGYGGLFALDAATGVEQWWQYMPMTVPAVAGDVLFVGGRDEAVHALDALTGATLWRTDVDGVPAAPSVSNGIVYATAAGSVVALQASDGAPVWRYLTGDTRYGLGTAVAGGRVFVGMPDGTYALNAGTGAFLWRAPVGGLTPALANGVVYVGGRACDAATGQILWNSGIEAAAPAVADGIAYLAAQHYLYAMGR
jgi:outer membrane protein assembly factor BamB